MKREKKSLLTFEKPLEELYDKLEHLKDISENNISMEEETRLLEKRIEGVKRELFKNLSPLQIVQISRHILRPTTLDYIEHIFTDFTELHGDRYFADDIAMVGGIGKLNGRSCVIIGHQKGKNTKENIERNFGMSSPEGYRKALRLMHLAERFQKPIITFIDTPGAYPGIGAEERGQAEAIARNLREMSSLTVPFIAIVTGEGGSGGALGIGMGNRVLMLEYAIYSVISPEGCASILFRDAKKSNEAAINMKITAKDLLELKVIDGIIKEPVGGAHNNPQITAQNIKESLVKNLTELSNLSPREILADRYRKFRNLGIFAEGGI